MAAKEAGLTKGKRAATPIEAWGIAVLAWAVPGAGHLAQGKYVRGAILGGAVALMFVVGLALGGHLFSPFGGDESSSLLFRLAPSVANFGTGLLYLGCSFGGLGFTDKSFLPTSEYGNTFLWVSGLINYLVMLDAFDIRAGRKS